VYSQIRRRTKHTGFAVARRDHRRTSQRRRPTVLIQEPGSFDANEIGIALARRGGGKKHFAAVGIAMQQSAVTMAVGRGGKDWCVLGRIHEWLKEGVVCGGKVGNSSESCGSVRESSVTK
jgi:hypothetical protein